MYVAAKYSLITPATCTVMVEVSHPGLLRMEDDFDWLVYEMQEGETLENFSYAVVEGEPSIVVVENTQATLARAGAALRSRRNVLLRATDATQIREDFTTEQREAWAGYRATLRAWPEEEVDILSPTEPTPPNTPLLAQMLSFIGER